MNLSISKTTQSFIFEPLINKIIIEYFLPFLCITVVSDTEIFLNSSACQFVRINLNVENDLTKHILKASEHGCFNYIISLNQPYDFLKSFDQMHISSMQRRDDRKMVILLSSDNLCSDDDTIKLFNSNAVKFTIGVVLILASHCSNTTKDLPIYMYNVVTHASVGVANVTTVTVINNWNSATNEFTTKLNLFPDIMRDMQGHEVAIATFNYKPYALFNTELQDNGNITNMDLDGTEAKAVVEFCRWSNCTLRLIRDDEHEWGEVWDNRSGNGIIGNVVMDYADIGFGALYTWYHEYKFLDFTMPLSRTGITCVAPAPRLLPKWQLPLHPFTLFTWITVIVSIALGTLAIYITGYWNQHGHASFVVSTLAVFGIMMSQPSTISEVTSRRVVVLLLLLSLVVINAYSSGLASSITVPKYEGSIDTVQDLVNSNINWGATHEAWLFSLLEATEPNLVHLRNHFEKLPEKQLLQKGKQGNFAYSIERLPAGHYAIGEYISEEYITNLQLMREDIYWEQCIMMTRKSSPFTRRLNEIIGRLHSSGLLLAWETQVVMKHSNNKVQLGVKISRTTRQKHEAITLKTTHFQGVYIFWMTGVILSTIIFITETFGIRKM